MLRHLLGVRICPYCPDCNSDQHKGPACQDLLGSNATAVGGIFGRVDAIFGSIENQKAGAFHIHTQVFVQCLHQHTPLYEILELVKERKVAIVQEYLAYADHVSKTSYDDLPAWHNNRQQREAAWPEYATDTTPHLETGIHFLGNATE